MSHFLIVSHRSLPAIGGVELIIDQELKALAEAGHTATWLASDCKSVGKEPRYPEGIRLVKVRSLKFLDEKLGIPYPLFPPSVLSLLWKEIRRCDVLHVHGSLFPASLPAFLIAWWLGKRRLLTEHVVFNERRYLQPTWILEQIGMQTVGRLCAALSQRIVTYNDRVFAFMRGLTRAKEKVCFVPYVIDTSAFWPPSPNERQAAREALGWNDERPKVLFLGRLIADKGVHLLLDCGSSRYDLVFCGPGTDAVRAKISARGFTCLPPRRHEDVRALYHAADLVVLPSCREGFPLVAKEAIACGVKVLLAEDIGYESYRRLPGLSFCRRDPQGIREAIVAALESGEAPQRQAEEVPERAAWRWLGAIHESFA